ncbi:MAG TPA: class I SAM-dependent methyltransferase [Vicinamibacterales bacterium]|jgi:SAM-dependent methyltransferase
MLNPGQPPRPELAAILRCDVCLSTLEPSAGNASVELVCAGCRRRVPVVDGIPRFVDVPADPTAARTQQSFGYEWTHFNDWRQSGETNFNDYFQGVDFGSLGDKLVLDAGCGMGRHTRQLAPFVRRIVALDFSRAVDQAARNTAGQPNVDCIQADLLAPPFADETFDFVYSLGVLHHLEHTERALNGLVRKLRPGGRLRVYLYWKRHGWKGRLLSVVTAARRVTTQLPFPALRAGCAVLSVALFGAVVLPYRALSAAGIQGHEEWPLFVYSKYPFNVLYNDQFDRFSAPIEKRYDAEEVRLLLERVGLRDVRVLPCFGWIGEGTKPR